MRWKVISIYKEIVRPRLLVYSHGSEDENDPGQFEETVTFDEQAGKTLITMRGVFKSKKEQDEVVEKYGAIEGGNQTLNRLEEYLKK